MPEANCIGLPTGAVAVDSAALELPVRKDLNAAVTGLLSAYKANTPDAFRFGLEHRQIVLVVAIETTSLSSCNALALDIYEGNGPKWEQFLALCNPRALGRET